LPIASSIFQDLIALNFFNPGPNLSGWFISARVADLFESAFDQLFALLADVMINGSHRLNGASRWTSESEFAIGHFALIKRKWTISEDDEAAIGEFAAFVFMEIEDNFFVCKCIFADFHLIIRF
jgi:hypothetical protein